MVIDEKRLEEIAKECGIDFDGWPVAPGSPIGKALRAVYVEAMGKAVEECATIAERSISKQQSLKDIRSLLPQSGETKPEGPSSDHCFECDDLLTKVCVKCNPEMFTPSGPRDWRDMNVTAGMLHDAFVAMILKAGSGWDAAKAIERVARKATEFPKEKT